MSDQVELKNTYRISWVNENGKTVRNWVKQTGKDSYWVLRKDGSKMEVKSKGGYGHKMIVLAEGDLKSKTPAVMNKTYAELEVRKSGYEKLKKKLRGIQGNPGIRGFSGTGSKR